MKLKFIGVVIALPFLFAGCSKTSQDGMNSTKGRYASNSQDDSYTRTNAMRDSSYYQNASERAANAKRSGAEAMQVVYFDFDSSKLNGREEEVIGEYAAFLLSNPNTKLRIEGHTDERGSREYNVALGERRANSVAKILASHGVPSNRYEIISYGAEKPAVRGQSEEAWSKNRRARVAVTSDKSVG